MSTTVGRVRSALMLLVLPAVLATVLSACADSGGSTGGSDGGPDQVDAVRAATTERAQQVIPLVAEALGATAVRAHGQWQSCMAISWRYEAFATVEAADGEAAAQLEQVRSALVDAGWEDTTQVEGHVTVERDDTTVDVQPTPARGRGTWTVSVTSSCADYDGDDLERVENDEPREISGV